MGLLSHLPKNVVGVAQRIAKKLGEDREKGGEFSSCVLAALVGWAGDIRGVSVVEV